MRASQPPNGPAGLGHLARAWLSALLTGKRQAKPSGWRSEQGPLRAKGFAEQGAWRPQTEHSAGRQGDFDAPVNQAGTQPFVSIGPQGHRERMREKLLSRGTDSLADYELLEMLLFSAFKRGDTKPLAKALINRFGSFGGVLSAPQQELLDTRGLGTHSVAAIKLVQASAVRLARAEVMERPVLNNWDRLMDYLNVVLARERVEQFRVLFLDSRNRLLADEAQARGTVNHTPGLPARGGQARAGIGCNRYNTGS